MEEMRYLPELDDYFLISGEMIEGHGEDSFYAGSTERAVISAVFDGCGGIGSRKYSRFSGYSGAYMASRAASGAMHDWFHDFNSAEGMSNQEIGTTMCSYLRKAVKTLDRIGTEPTKIAGMLVRSFPTTAAIAFVRDRKDRQQTAELHCLWAGDSRVYLLDERGLAQLTADDIENRDAMHNLRADGAMTNMLAADMDFTLHHRVFSLQNPAVILTATDGCFGYLPTPMHFEQMILMSLLKAETPVSFENNLRKKILDVTGDDYTMGGMYFGFGCFEALRERAAKRESELEKRYMEPMRQDESEEKAQEIWESYKKDYLRFLC